MTEDEPDCHSDVLVKPIEGLEPVDESAARDDSPSILESDSAGAVGSVGEER